MLDPRVTELADRIIQVQFDERVELLNGDIRRVQSQMAARGLGTSGPYVNMVYELCFKDIEFRALIMGNIWSCSLGGNSMLRR